MRKFIQLLCLALVFPKILLAADANTLWQQYLSGEIILERFINPTLNAGAIQWQEDIENGNLTAGTDPQSCFPENAYEAFPTDNTNTTWTVWDPIAGLFHGSAGGFVYQDGRQVSLDRQDTYARYLQNACFQMGGTQCYMIGGCGSDGFSGIDNNAVAIPWDRSWAFVACGTNEFQNIQQAKETCEFMTGCTCGSDAGRRFGHNPIFLNINSRDVRRVPR